MQGNTFSSEWLFKYPFSEKAFKHYYKCMVDEQDFNEKEIIDVDKSSIVDETNNVDKNEN